MERIPILRMGNYLLVTIQVDMHDKLALTLQAQKASLKIIYTTGYSVDALNTDYALDEGVNFIAKPYKPEKLAHIVRRSLDETSPKPPEQTLVAEM